ncbi:potassium channel family protein [Rossellomorea vietnamensis]|uniref:Potassium channel family protein n=1 Tax=Rossellomorea vietnamensis TaxID=218284 RepID=A0ACD4C5C9_9BACI|nr:potassium channel family protein [Rossellomorea vietnamensis]UXH43718.1 potassium channel family protein [Rossellomorea vietnamensis]
MVQQLFHGFLRWPLVIRIFMIAITLMLSFGTVIHFIEPDTFPSLFDGIWWAIITTSTVGYGDFVPLTWEGRLLGIVLILVGAGFLSTYFVTLAAETVMTQNAYLEGKATFKGKEHVIIVGWNERTREVINQLTSLQSTCDIILVDETLQKNPYNNHHIHFVKGTPFKDSILKKANLNEASIAIITADQNKDEMTSDMNSVLTLLAIKGNHPGLYTVVEILQKDQVANAKRAGADEVIQTNMQTSYVMMNSIISQGMSKTILKLLNHLKGNNLKLIPVAEEYINENFHSLSGHLLKNNIILLGIKKGENTSVNPPLTTIVEASDELLVISN